MSEVTIENLASGFLGAVIGVVAAWFLQWRQRRADEQGAVRAVYMEVVANGMPLILAKDAGMYAPLTNATWLATVDRVSRRLTPTQLMTVATYYHYVDAIRGRDYPVAGTPSADLQQVATDAMKAFAEAAMVLEEVGWSPGERASLHKTSG